ncbi:MAG: D-2-hydroxyacid dehydrogenase [Anaerolineae bacterium]|nr:D-2-hydroxyacid dehydrogenase [Anaerolineae bacterium]
MADGDTINVVVATEISDVLVNQIREVSPRLHVERHFPTVPDKVLASAEILFTSRTLPKPEQAPNLRWVQLYSAGVNHVAGEPLMQVEDIEVTTTSGIHATPMSEFCLAMMLAFNYRLPRMLELQAKGEWMGQREGVFYPQTLRGQTLGIVGYGSIGRELARAADALGMIVLATKRDVMHPADEGSYTEPGTGDPEGEIPTRLYPPEAIGSMARECDYLVITAPLTDATRHMVNAAVLKQMKKTAVLINVGRGAVVDEAALIEALQTKRIAGAGLDVFEIEPLPADSPLWALDNVIVSPHVSGWHTTYDEKSVAVFIENLQRYLDGRPLLNRVQREYGY